MDSHKVNKWDNVNHKQISAVVNYVMDWLLWQVQEYWLPTTRTIIKYEQYDNTESRTKYKVDLRRYCSNQINVIEREPNCFLSFWI